MPDGSGALIRTGQETQNQDTLRFAVYGQDAALPVQEGVYSALVPAFGVKQGSSAFAVLIEQGDALATISAGRAGGETGYYQVGAQFAITPFAQEKTRMGLRNMSARLAMTAASSYATASFPAITHPIPAWRWLCGSS